VQRIGEGVTNALFAELSVSNYSKNIAQRLLPCIGLLCATRSPLHQGGNLDNRSIQVFEKLVAGPMKTARYSARR
jgi:hypothetical protein